MTQKTITFEPSIQDAQFIAAEIAAGHYKTQSELIRAAIRQLQKESTRWQALRRLIDEGDESGAPHPFILEDFLAAMRSEHNAK